MRAGTQLFAQGYRPVVPRHYQSNISNRYSLKSDWCRTPWKVRYMALYPGHFRDIDYSSAGRLEDVWDMLSTVAVHRYSVDEWKKYLSLFDGAINNVFKRLDGILAAHGNVVPVVVKLAVLRTSSQLLAERSFYLALPQIISMLGDKNSAFAMRFTGVIRPLSSLARSADKEREALEPDI